MIKKVKEQRDIETNALTGYIINDTIYVPIDPANRHYQEIQEWIKQGGIIEQAFTEAERLEHFKQKLIKELKEKRDKQVSQIVVTLDSGEQLNGDEIAQTRMTRALNGLPDDETEIDWIDYNNNTIKLTRPKLREALQKAGQAQTEIYVEYNNKRQEILQAESLEKLGIEVATKNPEA